MDVDTIRGIINNAMYAHPVMTTGLDPYAANNGSREARNITATMQRALRQLGEEIHQTPDFDLAGRFKVTDPIANTMIQAAIRKAEREARFR